MAWTIIPILYVMGPDGGFLGVISDGAKPWGDMHRGCWILALKEKLAGSALDPLGPSRLGVLRTTAPDPI